jgi:uncharacterized protein YndB with AHSA1/START domain
MQPIGCLSHRESRIAMVEINHRVGIAAPREQVHQSIATQAGVASWWSRDAEGDGSEGGQLRFFFGEPEPRLVVDVESVTPDHVVWRCVKSPEEWSDTTITFDLSEADGETVVRFTHAGWADTTPFNAHCSTKWAYFLLGIKAMHEGGKATPFPGELKMSSWG